MYFIRLYLYVVHLCTDVDWSITKHRSCSIIHPFLYSIPPKHYTNKDTPFYTIQISTCRNSYESEAGSFEGAIPLNTSIFSESWEKLDEILKNVPKDTPVMTFCTGGIRCIKVNAYLKQKLGMKNICRLKKGIIGYEQWIEGEQSASNEDEVDEVEMVSSTGKNKESLFQGKNFLFDRRRL